MIKDIIESVEWGSKAYVEGNYNLAYVKFGTALDILKNLKQDENENVQYMIKYLLSITLIEFHNIQNVLEALEILLDLLKKIGNKSAIVHYGLAKAYIKLKIFNLAEKIILQGIKIVNDNIHLETFSIPIKCHIIKETTKKGLLIGLLELLGTARQFRNPDAKCALENCKNIFLHCPEDLSPYVSKDIYYSDPIFTGFIAVTCNNKRLPCNLKFHPVCWEFIKNETLEKEINLKEIQDSEMIGQLCPDPICANDTVVNTIAKIEIYNRKAKIVKIFKDEFIGNESLFNFDKARNQEQFEFLVELEDKKMSAFLDYLLKKVYAYVKLEKVVNTKNVLSKWNETKEMLTNDSETILDLFWLKSDENILYLLVRHTKLTRVGEYICIPEIYPQILSIFEIYIIEYYKMLLPPENGENKPDLLGVDEIFKIYNKNMEEGGQIDERISKYFPTNTVDNDSDQMVVEYTETKDSLTEYCHECVIDDDNTMHSTSDISNIADVKLFTKRINSVEEKERDNKDTTSKGDNTNSEEKNEETVMNPIDELMNKSQKENGYFWKNLNVLQQFKNKSSSSCEHWKYFEILSELHKLWLK